MKTTIGHQTVDRPSSSTEKSETLGKYLQKLANITKLCVVENQMDKAKRYLQIAEGIYNEGDAYTRSMIASVYVFSVSTFLEIRDMNIREMFPASLWSEYYQQVNSSTP
jgi:hypothetical protein